MFKTYRKTATVNAKIFEKGDEDGFVSMEDDTVPQQFKIEEIMKDEGGLVPYITSLESQRYFGRFGQYYICHGANDDKWLVEKGIFDKTYELVE